MIDIKDWDDLCGQMGDLRAQLAAAREELAKESKWRGEIWRDRQNALDCLADYIKERDAARSELIAISDAFGTYGEDGSYSLVEKTESIVKGFDSLYDQLHAARAELEKAKSVNQAFHDLPSLGVQLGTLRADLDTARAEAKQARAKALEELFEVRLGSKCLSGCCNPPEEWWIRLKDEILTERMGPFANEAEARNAIRALVAREGGGM